MTIAASASATDRHMSGTSQLRSNGFIPSDRRSYTTLFVMDHFFGRDRVDGWFPRWRRDVHRRMLNRIRQNGEGRAIPLPRIRNLDRETYMKEFVRKSHPVVFEGAAKDWE